ncbi:MAG: type secretion system protein GspH [Pseudomonadota bacterium]|jgi:general secretion pathway protein H
MDRQRCHDTTVRGCGLYRVRKPSHEPGGFTLIELLVVLLLVAVTTGLVALGAGQSPSTQLQREGERLAAWLENARTLARVQNQAIQGRWVIDGIELWGASAPGEARPRLRWLSEDTQPLRNDIPLLLGPEPILPAQSLSLGSRSRPDVQVQVATSGVGSWQVRP